MPSICKVKNQKPNFFKVFGHKEGGVALRKAL
jgi:hypothetical protein